MAQNPNLKKLAEILYNVLDAIRWVIEEPLFTELSDYEEDLWISSEEIDIGLEKIKKLFNIEKSLIENMAEEHREEAEKRLKEFKKRMKAKFPETTFWWEE
jgi:D-serine dehydratase